MEKNLIKNFDISGKEETLGQLLSDLKFISKIKQGEKIDVKSMTLVNDFQSLVYRIFISRESRKETYDFIKKVINRAIDMTYYYFSLNGKKTEYEKKKERVANNDNVSVNMQSVNFNIDIAKIIISNLSLAKEGLINLKETYEKDRKFVTDLETIIETMEIKIRGKNKLLTNDKNEH